MKKLASIAAALTMLASSASAQVITTFSTGNLSQWTACRALIASPTCTDFGAVRDAGQAGGWPAADWITPDVAGAPSFGSTSGENPTWRIVYRMKFNGLGGPSNATVFGEAFYLDNYFGGFRLNGAAVTPTWLTGSGYAGTPLPPNGGNWTKKFGFTFGPEAINDGENTFDIEILGNGRTDAMAATGQIETSRRFVDVPEPNSIALVGAGLAAMAMVARRRRVS